jgi:hypothetical protein
MEERKGRNCPACGKPLSSSPADAGPVEPERQAPSARAEPSWDRPTPSGYRAPGWGSVGSALTLAAIGWFLVQISLVIGYIISSNEPYKEPSVGRNVLAEASGYALIGGGIVFLTGLFMSCAAPGQSASKLFGILVALVLLLGVVFFVLLMVGEQKNRLTSRENESQAWAPEIGRLLGYGLVISIFLAMLLFTAFQCAMAYHLRKRILAGCVLVFLILQLAGIITLFVLASKEEGLWLPGTVFGSKIALIRPGRYLTLPFVMLILKKWWTLGISSFLCLWFLVQSLLLRHAVKRAMHAV